MPPDVAQRIDAALAGGRDEAAGPSSSETTVVPMSRVRRSRAGWLAGGVAAAVVAALVAVLVVGHVGRNDGKAGANTLAQGATNATIPTSVVTSTGRNYTTNTINTDVAALLTKPAMVAGPVQGSGAVAGPTGGGNVPGPTPNSSKATSSVTTEQHTAVVPQQLAALSSDPAALGQCVSALLGDAPRVAPLAVDLAKWNGQPAAIFVFPKPNDPSHVSVYVVPPGGCQRNFFEFWAPAVPRS
jgi:hypothetical protein